MEPPSEVTAAIVPVGELQGPPLGLIVPYYSAPTRVAPSPPPRALTPSPPEPQPQAQQPPVPTPSSSSLSVSASEQQPTAEVTETSRPRLRHQERVLRESRASGERSIEIALAEVKIISQNVYVQRKPRRLSEEEIPVCACKPPEHDDRLGCLEDCVNRAALIECSPGFCPCGDRCDNQRIQRSHMPACLIIDCGKKGLGLQLLQDVKAGEFVAEYMGEIVTEQEYHLRRLRYHNEKHRYMMVLSGGEVIDATRMGGFARFINHSCEPNCGVEKWEVNGEERCAIFALQDIHAGEELTFDYKFESFSRLEITTCLCGSGKCRRFIGINNHAKGNGHTNGGGGGGGPDRPTRFDPITKSKVVSSRKAAESTIDRMYRVLAGRKFLTKGELTFLGKSRVLLRRNLVRQVEDNMLSICLEPHCRMDEDEDGLGELSPCFRLRELPDYPRRRPDRSPEEKRSHLETIVTRLRRHDPDTVPPT